MKKPPALPPSSAAPQPLSATEIFRGRHVFILGSTGFVGKVLLSMLLDRFPEIGRVYVMVRRGSGTDSETRFWQSVVTSPAFDPLRSRHGGRDGLAEFLRHKVRVVDGDITEKNLGLSEEEAERVAKDIDVLINSSGRVTFNPPLESALKTNVEGTKNVIAFAKRMKRPALVHTSTCFVAGVRSGEVWESEELDGYFPRHGELPGTHFSVEQEMADSERGAARIRELADDAQVLARLRQQARERLREENRDPDDEGALRLAVARARKEWIRAELTRQGIERAAAWGWPNIYTYTKSMGDQLVAREKRDLPIDRAPRDRRERGRVSVPRLERGLHHVGAAGLPGAQGAERAAGLRKADPRRGAGRSRRRRHADGGGAGLRRAAAAGPPAVERRSQPDAHGPRRHADRALQAQALPGQGDRQPVHQRAGGAHGVPPGDAGGVRRAVAAVRQPRRAEGVDGAGARPPALGRWPLHRGHRSHQEERRRGQPRHRRGAEEHRAVPPVHLRQPVRLPRRPHPRAARSLHRRRPEPAALGARGAGLVRLLDEHPLPRPAALGAARARRDLRRAPQADLQLPRPAGAVRHHDQAARDARRAAHRARQARGDLQLRRSAGAGEPRWRLPGRARRSRPATA